MVWYRSGAGTSPAAWSCSCFVLWGNQGVLWWHCLQRSVLITFLTHSSVPSWAVLLEQVAHSSAAPLLWWTISKTHSGQLPTGQSGGKMQTKCFIPCPAIAAGTLRWWRKQVSKHEPSLQLQVAKSFLCHCCHWARALLHTMLRWFRRYRRTSFPSPTLVWFLFNWLLSCSGSYDTCAGPTDTVPGCRLANSWRCFSYSALCSASAIGGKSVSLWLEQQEASQY